MSEPGIQVLLTPLPGQRIADGQTPEDGSILAYRKGGDEVLFGSWFIDEEDDKPGKGMVWIPVGEFSPDPEAIKPPNLLQEDDPDPQQGSEGPTETESEGGPFGRPRGSRSRRPGI